MNKSAAFSNSRRQAGFTMVELAIVLVIAGIILTGALKGTDMINKAKKIFEGHIQGGNVVEDYALAIGSESTY